MDDGNAPVAHFGWVTKVGSFGVVCFPGYVFLKNEYPRFSGGKRAKYFFLTRGDGH